MANDLFAKARKNMIDCQLVPANVQNPAIVEAMASVPRELFVPDALKGSAYLDEDIPLVEGRYLMEPLALARLLQLAAVTKEDKVLDVACATGYSTVLLALMAKEVVALEKETDLAEKARQLLNRLHTPNARVTTGALNQGVSAAQPYNVIFINGAVERLPDAMVEQLASGGRIVAVEMVAARPGQTSGLGKAVVYRKKGHELLREEVFDLAVHLLPGFEKEQNFVF